jgi:hypothetical protein
MNDSPYELHDFAVALIGIGFLSLWALGYL